MRKIIYYVASSLDGYIAGENGDISQFVFDGNGVEKYQSDLAGFDTVIMGRKTYEFGYAFGLEAGQPAYPHMNHHIFSESLHFENQHEKVFIEKLNIQRVIDLKEVDGTEIYLCGGGEFAGWLLDHNLIDVLKIKLNAIVLGKGTKLFGTSTSSLNFELASSEQFERGLLINTYLKINN